MLNSKNALATIAVKSVKDARRFYGDVLSLKVGDTGEEGVLSVTSGQSSILVYESQFAGTNKATAATWFVGNDLDAIVASLKARGVAEGSGRQHPVARQRIGRAHPPRARRQPSPR